MNPFSEDIKDLLVAGSVGVLHPNASAGDYAISIGHEPAKPDRSITLYDSGGFDPEYIMDGTTYRQPTVQARIRGREGEYLDAYAKAEEVLNTLDRLAPQTINGAQYSGIWAVGDIARLGLDKQNRPLFTINFRTMRT